MRLVLYLPSTTPPKTEAKSTTTSTSITALSLLSLDEHALQHIVLLLDLEDANAARRSCTALHDVTLAPGFAKLWRLSHQKDELAKMTLRRMHQHFEHLDEQPLDTETAPLPGSEWSRVLPPRNLDAPIAAAASSAAASSSSQHASACSSVGSPTPRAAKAPRADASSSSQGSSADSLSVVSPRAAKAPRVAPAQIAPPPRRTAGARARRRSEAAIAAAAAFFAHVDAHELLEVVLAPDEAALEDA